MALTTPYYGECWNPTEAGGSMDYTGMETKSELQYVTLSGSTINTQVCVHASKRYQREKCNGSWIVVE